MSRLRAPCVAASRLRVLRKEMNYRSYQDLIVWQKAMVLAEKVYQASASITRDEIYGITSQIRRSAVSIASNIAEGQGRGRSKEFASFLRIARGSLCELETQIKLAKNLNFITQDQFQDIFTLCDEVGRLSFSLLKAVSNYRSEATSSEPQSGDTLSAKRDAVSDAVC